MKLGLYGKKLGMTQLFDETALLAVPVTIVEIYAAEVLEHRTLPKNGYQALVLGFNETAPRKLNKPKQGYLKPLTPKSYRSVREIRVPDLSTYPCGALIGSDAFSVGERVNVMAISKGKGFQGVIKRHGKGGGPAAHGSGFHRTTGSIGQRTYPGRVFKNMGMAGRMGGEQVKTKNLKVVHLDAQKGLLFVRGAIPGAISGLVFIESQRVSFESGVTLPQAAE